MKKMHFFVSDGPGKPTHVESEDDCEVMLCGQTILIDAPNIKIQSWWGPRKCPDCFVLFTKERARQHGLAKRRVLARMIQNNSGRGRSHTPPR